MRTLQHDHEQGACQSLIFAAPDKLAHLGEATGGVGSSSSLEGVPSLEWVPMGACTGAGLLGLVSRIGLLPITCAQQAGQRAVGDPCCSPGRSAAAAAPGRRRALASAP